MLEIFIRTFFLVLILELGSASQMTVCAIATHSHHPILVWIASALALSLTSWIAIMVGRIVLLSGIPINLFSGLLMVATGLYLLWHR